MDQVKIVIDLIDREVNELKHQKLYALQVLKTDHPTIVAMQARIKDLQLIKAGIEAGALNILQVAA